LENRPIPVTTGLKARDEYVKKALQYAEEIGGIYVERNKRGLRKMQEIYGDLLLVVSERVKLHIGEEEFFFHPSMANTRIKRLKSGENDIVIEYTDARPGDVVLDCTLGLGSDSIVFSHVVGPSGQVIGVESSPVIACIVRRGLREVTVDVQAVNAAMRRVEVVCADHLDYMRTLPDQSVDIVYFDPMFRRTVEKSHAMEPMRVLGDDRPIRLEAVEEAKRVARRRIVMKERWYSKEFQRLGFKLLRKSSGSTNYGVIDLKGAGI
jgi:16S rRNA (guanine1516-N2)-methyltransferase